ncbi:MmcQ/YjbR family DNA-binding protein [Hoeflea sp. CAU 1731]
MTWDDVVAFALTLPEVVQSTSYGELSLKVGKKMLARLRWKDNSIVLPGVHSEEREMLSESAPDIFFWEPHYQDYAIVLARLDNAGVDDIAGLIERRWRAIAPKRAIAARRG